MLERNIWIVSHNLQVVTRTYSLFTELSSCLRNDLKGVLCVERVQCVQRC
jgi:hypothetical protein